MLVLKVVLHIVIILYIYTKLCRTLFCYVCKQVKYILFFCNFVWYVNGKTWKIIYLVYHYADFLKKYFKLEIKEQDNFESFVFFLFDHKTQHLQCALICALVSSLKAYGNDLSWTENFLNIPILARYNTEAITFI